MVGFLTTATGHQVLGTTFWRQNSKENAHSLEKKPTEGPVASSSEQLTATWPNFLARNFPGFGEQEQNVIGTQIVLT